MHLQSSSKIRCTCPACKSEFWCFPSLLTTYCSVKCRWDDSGHRMQDRICEACGAPFRAKPAVIAKGKGRYCSQRCSSRVNGERKIADSPERFWTHVQKADGDACWLWLGAIVKDSGYGQTTLSGKKMTAHRASYLIAYETIPHDLWVLHRCDVRACVRPDHLFLGDHDANMEDAKAKGRLTGRPKGSTVAAGFGSGSISHPERVARGERSGTARISEDQVRELRLRYTAGGVTQSALAAHYGIDQTEVSLIVRRKHWAHVD